MAGYSKSSCEIKGHLLNKKDQIVYTLIFCADDNFQPQDRDWNSIEQLENRHHVPEGTQRVEIHLGEDCIGIFRPDERESKVFFDKLVWFLKGHAKALDKWFLYMSYWDGANYN